MSKEHNFINYAGVHCWSYDYREFIDEIDKQIRIQTKKKVAESDRTYI